MSITEGRFFAVVYSFHTLRIRKQCQRGVSLGEKKAAHLSPNLSHPWTPSSDVSSSSLEGPSVFQGQRASLP